MSLVQAAFAIRSCSSATCTLPQTRRALHAHGTPSAELLPPTPARTSALPA